MSASLRLTDGGGDGRDLYVLARIGLVTASYLVRVWRVSLFVIVVAAAVLSIFVAWACGRQRAAS